ncbi:DUF1992 domain-containing protein [Desulfuromonas versatilis]|uniref:DUF1992 domain-containing protein n=1 Tax=Desulfuromonas versatilis TaxID=2802975 RepID=A0ABM8HNQ6_9BACT|nr:DUF1992 domain-containing protein [Desulfuromonas versatilis]BCR03097.1 DUF1992 domain-containing protein [Desulfuromonas versatilis]
MDVFALIAERRILEAMQRGDFDNLALKGQPIARDECGEVPAELRMAYKVLKNAGMVPEEVAISRELVTLRNLVDCCQNVEERTELKKQLTEKALRFNLLMEKRGRSAAFEEYETRLAAKMGL